MNWLALHGTPWMGWQAWAHMGGYGLYVWGSFGVLALCLAWEAWHLRQEAARVRLLVAQQAPHSHQTEHQTEHQA